MNQDYEQTVKQVTQQAQSLNREMGRVAEQVANAQVATARAMFNISNAWTFGSFTPVISKFEEGLHLYEQTVVDMQTARQEVAERMIAAGRDTNQNDGQNRSSSQSQTQAHQQHA